MEFIRGSKKDIVIRGWEEQITKCLKRLGDSVECFTTFAGVDDIDRAIEDAEAVIKTLKYTRDALNAMEEMGIE